MAQVGTNKEGTAHKWPLCAPITLAHLLTLYLALDFCIHFHSAIWALALAAFFSCCHLGELTIPSHNAFKAKLHAFHHPANIQFHSHHNGSKSAHFCIPWTKTTKEEGATVVITAWNAGVPAGLTTGGIGTVPCIVPMHLQIQKSTLFQPIEISFIYTAIPSIIEFEAGATLCC